MDEWPRKQLPHVTVTEVAMWIADQVRHNGVLPVADAASKISRLFGGQWFGSTKEGRIVPLRGVSRELARLAGGSVRFDEQRGAFLPIDST